MRARLQIVGLILALGAVAAFLVSFVVGIGGGEGRGQGADGTVAPVPVRAPRVRVEVLNAAGRAGLAREATGRLRAGGFDVVYFGNARGFDGDTSVVLDRSGSPEAAQAVAAALGITRVRSAPDPSLLLEVTVVLGKDWPPREDGEEQAGVVGQARRVARRLRGAQRG